MASSALTRSSARDALLTARARFMLAHPTASEALLFSVLRGRRLGVSFRRQQVLLGTFIVDFLAREVKLVVEVDGDVYHDRRGSADAARERKLVRAGYTVLRVPASLVDRDLMQAAAMVLAAVQRARAAACA